MHHTVNEHFEKLKSKYPNYFESKKVFEGGSLDINGSIRQYFKNCDYIGVDLGPGKGVDLITPIHKHVALDTYDVVASTECGEHDIYFEESIRQMYNNLKSGGLFIYTAAGPKRHFHGFKDQTPQDSPYTNDFYKNIDITDFLSVLPTHLFSESEIKLVRGDTDIQFWGIKK